MVLDVQHQLERSISQAMLTAQTFQIAVDTASNVYGYAYWKSLNTVAAAALLRQAALTQGLLTPEVDRQLSDMTLNYLRDVDAARHTVSHHLLQMVNDVAAGQVNPDSLRSRLNKLLLG